MNEDTYRDKLNGLQVEVEELRAKLKEAQTGDLISRAAALDALTSTAGVGNRALDKIRSLPSAQPQQVTGKLNADCISRQAAISLPVKPKEDRYFQTQNLDDAYDYGWYSLQSCIEKLPPAQPEIVQCKDCKYSDENWRRVSVRWLPCMDVRTGSNWFCGSAERREE